MSTAKEANQVAVVQSSNDSIIASLVINGDTSKLTQQQKVDYYRMFCQRIGLDPMSQPFKLLRLNGKEVMYCDRSGAQQLNRVHKVSHKIVARETAHGCYVVTAQASTPDNRCTESIGAVPVDNLKGDQLCNAMMKAETKAKRRATLDLLGLGILDETETDTITNAQKIEAPVIVTATQPQIMAEDKTNPFRRKYDNATDISKVLKDTRDIKEVASLYYVNAEMIQATQELKAEFTTRKNELYNSQLPGGVSAAELEAANKAREEINLALLSISKSTKENLEAYRKGLPKHVKDNPSVFAAVALKKKELENA